VPSEGLRASASFKHVADDVIELDALGARDSTSLKLASEHGHVDAAGHHPRRSRLGLIKASYSQRNRHRGSVHPRRERLGLIEAGSTALRPDSR
jgi:hypothetical protein